MKIFRQNRKITSNLIPEEKKNNNHYWRGKADLKLIAKKHNVTKISVISNFKFFCRRYILQLCFNKCEQQKILKNYIKNLNSFITSMGNMLLVDSV